MRPRPTRVLWLIKGLGPGGAERLLVSMAAVSDRQAFAYEAAYLLPWKDHLVGELEALGVAVHCLDAPRMGDLRWVARLRRLVFEREIDVVHFHSPIVAGLARPALRAIPGPRRPALMSTQHNSWHQYRRTTRLLNAASYGLDSVRFAVSEEARESTGKRWRDRVDVVVHGVPLDEVRAQRALRGEVRRELGIGPDEIVFGTVANYRVHKDYPTLLRAARMVVDAGAGARFLAVGQGPLQADVEAEHARLGLGERFLLLGYRPDAVRCLAACDVFTLASTREGYPVALMEALALGLPVVATGVGGIGEAVRDGQEGVLVPPSRPDELASAMLMVARDASLRQRLATAAHARSAEYDITLAARRMERTYETLSSSRPVNSNRQHDGTVRALSGMRSPPDD